MPFRFFFEVGGDGISVRAGRVFVCVVERGGPAGEGVGVLMKSSVRKDFEDEEGERKR